MKLPYVAVRKRQKTERSRKGETVPRHYVQRAEH
jgi:hypothetical protein